MFIRHSVYSELRLINKQQPDRPLLHDDQYNQCDVKHLLLCS